MFAKKWKEASAKFETVTQEKVTEECTLESSTFELVERSGIRFIVQSVSSPFFAGQIVLTCNAPPEKEQKRLIYYYEYDVGKKWILAKEHEQTPQLEEPFPADESNE